MALLAMDFLEYTPEPIREWPSIPRVYGRVDSVEPESPMLSDSVQIHFECIDADWFDMNPPPGGVNTAAWHKRSPASVLRFQFETLGAVPPEIPSREGLWAEFSLRDTPSLQPVEHYFNLFQSPQLRYVDMVTEVSSTSQEELSRAMSTDEYEDAAVDHITDLLPRIAPEACIVVDVGQGNCNATVANGGGIDLYFDFWGGVRANASTYPTKLRSFCPTGDPPVVLSHWDWDHWSSAQRFAASKSMTWVVPRQTLGAVHRKFLSQLESVLVWPTGVPSVTSGPFMIEKCTGSGRNHSGLAVTITNGKERMLLTGDARYTSIPTALKRAYTAVVVPHHGGRLSSKRVPSSNGRPHARLAYSYGPKNTFKHAHPTTETAHAPFWGTSDLRTENRGSKGLGHIWLYWDSKTSKTLGCRGKQCDLSEAQR